MTTSVAARPRPAPGQRTAVGGIPLIRVRPAPSFEPPYDDEPRDDEPAPAAAAPVGVGPRLADRPGRSRRRGSGDRRGPADQPGEDPSWGPAPAGPVGGSPPRAGTGGQAAYRYVALCLEVLEGFRPATHLRRLTYAASFESVLEQLARPAARTGHPSSAGPMPGAGVAGGRATPAGGGRRPGAPGSDRLRLRRLWVGEPSNGVVEAAAVVGRADRAWALALRLERREDAWLCTDLQVI